MADIGIYGGLGGLGQEIREYSKEQSTRQWDQYQANVEAMRQENLARIRHSMQVELDNKRHERDMAKLREAHRLGIVGEEEKLKLGQQYPSLAERTGEQREKREREKWQTEKEKCDETFELDGEWWCRQGTTNVPLTRPAKPEEKARAKKGLIEKEMGEYADVEDYMPALERQFQDIEQARVPLPYPAQTSKGRSKAASAGGGLKSADAGLFLRGAASLLGGDWDPITGRPMGLNKEQAEQVQAIAAYAEQLYAEGIRTSQPIERLQAISQAAKELFNINIRQPGGQGLLGGAMAPSQGQPMPRGPRANDPLGLGL